MPIVQESNTNFSGVSFQGTSEQNINEMTAYYDFFRTPQSKDKNKVRFHARSVVTDKVDTRDMVSLIARRSSFKEGDVIGVLMVLEDVVRQALADGKCVHLEGIGSFRISAKSPSVRDRHEIRSESIRFGGVVYKADRRLLKSLANTKFVRVKETGTSSDISEIEIDGRLTEHFKDHAYITTHDLQRLCGLSYMTALRRLKSRVAEGKLTHPGHVRAPFYFPVPGNYGVSRG